MLFNAKVRRDASHSQKQYLHAVCLMLKIVAGFPKAGCFLVGSQNVT